MKHTYYTYQTKNKQGSQFLAVRLFIIIIIICCTMQLVNSKWIIFAVAYVQLKGLKIAS